jgi:hypothetical protein
VRTFVSEGLTESSPVRSAGKSCERRARPVKGTIENARLSISSASRIGHRSSRPGRIAWKKVTQHFVLGYFQMSLRD